MTDHRASLLDVVLATRIFASEARLSIPSRRQWLPLREVPFMAAIHSRSGPAGGSADSGALTDWRSLHGDAFAGERVLITGGAGFIGSHLAHALSTLGA